MKNRFLTIFLSLIVMFSLSIDSSAAITSGTKCSKVGVKQVYKGKTYTCIKSGKKLVWDKGFKVDTYDAAFAAAFLAEAKDKAAQILADAKITANQMASPPKCKTLSSKASVAFGQDLSNNLLSIEFKNSEICDLVVQASVAFLCPDGKVQKISNYVTSSGIFPLRAGEKLNVTALNVSRYFPQVLLECRLLTRYSTNLVQISTFHQHPSVKTISSNFSGKFDQIEATKKANQYLNGEKKRADKVIADAKNPTAITKAWKAALEAEAVAELKAKQEAEARAASAGNAAANPQKDRDLGRVDGLGKKCAPGDWCLLGTKGPGGGVVFYDAGSQQSWGRFLEVAPEDWSFTGCSNLSSGCDPLVSLSMSPWCYPTEKSGAGDVTDFVDKVTRETEIGAGKANTEAMLLACSSKKNGAAQVRAYRGGGLSDWYLPSKDELNELCKYAKFQDTGNPTIRCEDSRYLKKEFYGAAPYWSSSEYDSGYAFYQNFSTGRIWALSKDYWSIILRPIRAF